MLLCWTRWGLAGSILALETLKLALTMDNRARDTLVGAALAAGLVPRLLSKLDWRKGSGASQGEEEVWCCSHMLFSTASLTRSHVATPKM